LSAGFFSLQHQFDRFFFTTLCCTADVRLLRASAYLLFRKVRLLPLSTEIEQVHSISVLKKL
ncbi:MAG: hypothetical protein WCK32_10300, partial [Chlorobiaceae bacterium]